MPEPLKTMCDVSADAELAKAVALSSLEVRIEHYVHNRDIMRFCQSCAAPIYRDKPSGRTQCDECLALERRGWMPRGMWLLEKVFRFQDIHGRKRNAV